MSKSILRAAANQLARAADPRLVYWPSFEIVRWFGAHMVGRSFGGDDGNSRHVNADIVRLIVELFVETFGDSAMTRISAGDQAERASLRHALPERDI